MFETETGEVTDDAVMQALDADLDDETLTQMMLRAENEANDQAVVYVHHPVHQMNVSHTKTYSTISEVDMLKHQLLQIQQQSRQEAELLRNELLVKDGEISVVRQAVKRVKSIFFFWILSLSEDELI